MHTLGLESCAKLPYKRLSGGQQQRLSLACAVVGRPELVFLDEPTSSLDPQGRHLVWDLVRALRTDGVAVLLTTHLMQEAETLADDVVIVDHGRVVAAGSPDELTTAGSEDMMRFRAVPGMDLALLDDVLPEGHLSKEGPPGHYTVAGSIDPQVLAAVTAWCARQGVLADDVRMGGAAWRTSSSTSPDGSCARDPLRRRHLHPRPRDRLEGADARRAHPHRDASSRCGTPSSCCSPSSSRSRCSSGSPCCQGLVELPEPRVNAGAGHRPRPRDDVDRRSPARPSRSASTAATG